jgi:hypothetical protein
LWADRFAVEAGRYHQRELDAVGGDGGLDFARAGQHDFVKALFGGKARGQLRRVFLAENRVGHLGLAGVA